MLAKFHSIKVITTVLRDKINAALSPVVLKKNLEFESGRKKLFLAQRNTLLCLLPSRVPV